MKIAVVGAGAIGGLIGGLLARAGEDVTLINRRKEHVDTINRDGLLIDGTLGKMRITVKAAEMLDFSPELLLLAVKTQDVLQAAQEVKPYVTGVPVVTMQNGVRSDEIAASVLGKENIISCVIFMGGVTFLQPGQIFVIGARGLMIGEAFGKNRERTQNIATILSQAVRTGVSDNIKGMHFTKLILNLTNGIPAVTGLSRYDCANEPALIRISVLLMKEGLEVIEKSGIKLESLPGMDLDSLTRSLKLPLEQAIPALRESAPETVGINIKPIDKFRYGSTLQSIKWGDKTEIDYLNGEIVRLGRRLGMLTPFNAKMVDLVHSLEITHVFLSPEELSKAMVM